MRHRVHRVLAGSLLTVLTFALLVAGLPAIPLAVSAEEDSEQTALADFGACLSGEGSGSLVILMDQSGSLRDTDPDKGRVQAAHYLISRLTAFTASSGVALDVRVVGFAADYTPAGEWAALDATSGTQLKSQVTAVGDDIHDYDTDYWTALDGARQDLAAHDTSGCRAVAWLSDGAFDLDVRDSSAEKPYAVDQNLASESGVTAAEQAGLMDMCRATGLADQLRSSGITVLGIGLSSPNGEPVDFTLMKRITLGGGTNATHHGVEQCGDVSANVGFFYPVSDLDSLLLAFDSISAPGGTVMSDTVTICQGTVCTPGESTFVLDRSIDAVHILASSDVAGLDAYLYAPGSTEPIIISGATSGTQTSAGVTGEWLTPRTLEADLDAATATSWDGQWRLAFVDTTSSSPGQEAHVNIHLTSPLRLEWQDLSNTTLRQGEDVEARLVLRDKKDGEDIEAGRIVGGVKAQVRATSAAGETHILFETDDPADLEGPVPLTIPQDLALGQATVTTSLTVTTAPATLADGSTVEGTTLSPTEATTAVTINAALDFPVVGTRVDFGLLEEELSTTVDLPVTGPGCVWVDESALTLTGVPADAGDVSVSSSASSKDSCLTVAEGASGTLPLTLTASEHANGAVTGTIGVYIAPAEDYDRAQVVEVSFTGEMLRPLDVGTAWTVFALVLIAGIAIPVGLLYLMKLLTARMPGGTLLWATTVVEVPTDGSHPTIDVPSNQWEMKSVPKGARELVVGPYRFKAVAGASPTASPYVRLVSPEAPSISGSPTSTVKGRALLPLAVRGNWVAVLDQPDSPRHVTLILLASGGSRADDDIARVQQDVADRLASRLALVAPTGTSAPAAEAAPPAAAGFGTADSDAAAPGSVFGSGSDPGAGGVGSSSTFGSFGGSDDAPPPPGEPRSPF
ncbi:vWA domain-containing protein [Actinomyces respiraculi]|uniref:vWA domain-containing protein n=1 Tax=Actinomyces respiraculi TaxID=2744574 RepID=UPI0014228074|nr:vWA domain-containing protein [Actinomyces respiraculi]